MNKFKNENGAALVLTLMIITLFLVFILVLFTQVTNTTRQAKTMEDQIDAQLVAEMGIDYYQHLVESYIVSHSIQSPEDINLPDPNPIIIDERRSYQITNQRMEVQDNEVRITFTSIGKVASNVEKTIDDNLIIINFESE